MQEDMFQNQMDNDKQSLSQDNKSDSSKKSSAKMQRFKVEKIHIIYGISGIAMLFGAYLLLSPLFMTKASKQQNTSQNQTISQQWQQVNSPSLPTTGTDYSAYKQHSLSQKNDVVNADQLQTLIGMQQQMRKDLKSSYLMLATHIKSIETDLALVKEKVGKLTIDNDVMQKTQIALGNIEGQLQAITAARVASTDKLSLTAIVDGVAWLEDQNGYTRTVVKDSDIPGYGKVLKIDGTKNKVLMSSGYIFS